MVSNRMIEAKTNEIEAKYLSKDEIKELITDECSKNSCKNARDSNEREIIRPKVGHSSPRRLAGEKKCASYNHKTTIWVSHEYYSVPEFLKI